MTERDETGPVELWDRPPAEEFAGEESALAKAIEREREEEYYRDTHESPFGGGFYA
jgi:hypothetical protein